MSQNNISRRNTKKGFKSSNSSYIEEKQIFILIKAAPLPSKQYLETVCTAGVDEQGRWYRLYPIPFRFLENDSKFHKYQWVKIKIKPIDKVKDGRKESFRPDVDTIKPLGDPIPSKKWQKRASILLPLVKDSVEVLSDLYYMDGTSLGMIKPKKMVNFTVEKDETEWIGKKAFAQSQLRLFEPQPKKLKKVPYKFFYHFLCNDPRCKKPHRMSIHDWEIYMLYINIKNKYNYAEDVILQKIKDLWFFRMWDESRNAHLFLGTVHSRYKKPEFVVLGVFWPPKK